MKKNILLGFGLLTTLALASCSDYNDAFEGLDEMTKPSDVKNISYTLTADDYGTISSNRTNTALAKEEGVSTQLGWLKNDKYFNQAISPAKYIPAFLAATWYTADKGSSIRVTYDKSVDAPAYLDDLAVADNYEVSLMDYASVWGEVTANYFTPAAPLSKYADKMLTAAYPEAEAGDVKVVNYKYSISEPNTGGVSTPTSLNEDFSSITEADKNKTTELTGWLNVTEAGSKTWVNNYYNGGYTQFSAYQVTEETIGWLITPKVDLSNAVAPRLAFDVCLGYPDAAELQVLVSTDFNGSDVFGATWTNVADHFAFDDSNSRYGTFSPAGSYDMSAFKESAVYVAFRYVGGEGKTTTFQLDNIQLGDATDVVVADAYHTDFATGMGDWTQQVVQGSYTWSERSYGGNYYLQFSANKSTEEEENYLVSPAIEVPATGATATQALLFDLCIGYWNADCMQVLVSTDYAGDATTATWKDKTYQFGDLTGPTGGYGSFMVAKAAAIKEYAGQTIHVAFRYQGNGTDNRTTTVQVTNVRVASLSHAATRSLAASLASRAVGGVQSLSAVYAYNGSSWAPYVGGIAVSADDYSEMGFTTFSSTNRPDNYLPQFLAKNYPYAQEEDAVGVIYTYNDVQESAEYIYANGAWSRNLNIETVTDQFVYSGSVWNYDPSTTIILPPVRNHVTSVLYFQTATDWVWENVDVAKLGCTAKGQGYVTSYGNNEYYTGSSAYYCNVDMRPSAARSQYAAGYEGLSDDELIAKMKENFIEVMAPVLSILNPDAAPVEGIEVLYTIQFPLYTGVTVTECNYQVVYKVTAKGQFEYVEDSLQPIAQ